MSKSDSRINKQQVDSIWNKIRNFISVHTVLRYAEDYDTSDPLALIKRQDLYNATGGGITLIQRWVPGMLTDVNSVRSYIIDGVEYIFRSNVNENGDEPSFSNVTWDLLGISKEDIPGEAPVQSVNGRIGNVVGLAEADDINNPINISFSDLVSNTYTNADYSNQNGIIIYYDSNGLQSAQVSFNALGVTTLPFTAEPEFLGTLIGVSGSLGNFVRNSDIGSVTTSITLFNPEAEDMNLDTRVLSDGSLSHTPGSGNVTSGKLYLKPNTPYNFSGMSAGITKRAVHMDINNNIISGSVFSYTPATVQFTTPNDPNYSYTYATVIDVGGTGGILANVKLAEGTIPATDDYAASVVSIKNMGIIASTIKINDDLVNPNLLELKSGDVKLYISSVPNRWYARIPYSSTHDLVHVWGLEDLNLIPETKSVLKILNTIPDGENIFSPTGTIHSNPDSVPPPYGLDQGRLVGGGHVMGTSLVTLSSHGRVSALITSKWFDGTYNWFLVEIPDSNSLRFIPEQFLFPKGYALPPSFASNTLVYVSGGSGGDTSNIDVTNRVISSVAPCTFDRSYSLILDNIIISDSGLYFGDEFKIVDSHSLVDYRHITIQNPFIPNEGLPLLKNIITYSYDKSNTLAIDYTIDFRSIVYISDYPFQQAERFITSLESANVTLLYIPNTGDISNGLTTYNLAKVPQNIFNPLGGSSLIYGSGNIPDNTKCINRVIETQQTSLGDKKNGFAQTFSYELGITDYNSRKLLTEQWEIRGNSGKSYPRGIFNYSANNEVIQGRVYRSYWDTSINPNFTSVYAYKENQFWYLFIDTHVDLSKETCFIPKWLAGKSIDSIAETFGAISVLNNDYIPESCELILNSDVSVNGYAYIVLKLK